MVQLEDKLISFAEIRADNNVSKKPEEAGNLGGRGNLLDNGLLLDRRATADHDP